MEELKINKALISALLKDYKAEDQEKVLDSIVTTVNNYVIGQAEPLISKAKGVVKGETLQLLDDAAKEVEGIAGKRNEGEKSTDYIKRVIKDLNTQLKADSENIKALEKQIKDGSGDTGLKDKLKSVEEQKDALVKQVKELKESHKEEKERMIKENETAFVELALRSAAPKIKQGVFSNPEQEKILIDIAIKQIIETAERTSDGKIVFKDKDGKVLRNPDNNHEPFTATELLGKSKVLENLIETDRKVAGVGTPQKDDKDKDGNKVDISKYAHVKSKDELTEALNKDFKGKTDTPEYYETYRSVVSSLKL